MIVSILRKLILVVIAIGFIPLLLFEDFIKKYFEIYVLIVFLGILSLLITLIIYKIDKLKHPDKYHISITKVDEEEIINNRQKLTENIMKGAIISSANPMSLFSVFFNFFPRVKELTGDITPEQRDRIDKEVEKRIQQKKYTREQKIKLALIVAISAIIGLYPIIKKLLNDLMSVF